MTTDNWITLAVAAVPVIFYAGGWVMLTKNHLAHMAKDISNLLKGQRRQDTRINRIETTMMVWTGGKPKKGKR